MLRIELPLQWQEVLPIVIHFQAKHDMIIEGGNLDMTRNSNAEIAKATYDYYTTYTTAPRTVEYVDYATTAPTQGMIERTNHPEILILDATVDEALRYTLGKTAILNFASAVHPGGGVFSGANAQEEAICRASNLYMGISQHKQFYEKNKGTAPLYTNNFLYSENVEFQFTADGEKLEQPRKADVITYPAPNLNVPIDIPSNYMEVLQLRCDNIIRIANEEGIDTLILGAWGCGVFGNRPENIARAFQKALRNSTAKRVIFAIAYNRDFSRVFREVFGKIA